MPLSESTRNEIRTELAALHQMKVTVDERIKVLEAVLSPFDFAQVALPLSPAQPSQRAVAVHDSLELDVIDNASLEYSGGRGMRQAIRIVLKEMGKARAPEVAKELQRRGFPTAGKTRFSTRVYNDLWRMTERGEVRSEKGVFSATD